MFKQNQTNFFTVILLTAALIFTSSAFAAQEVRFVSVGWTGVTAKTELGVKILESIGYEASNTMVSVPIVYKAMETNEGDVFLGNWMPSMASIANKYFENGSVVKYIASMPNAKYTLAAPSYVVDGGLRDFKDIAKFADKLDHRIYGIEEGNDGNEIIQSMIDKDMFNLGDFTIIPSSEAGMLSQVQAYAKNKKWIIFLGWAPHYMNEKIDMKYLTGSTSKTFGENDGTATVYTNIRKGFDQEMPNVATFLKNFSFPISMMNQIIGMLNDDAQLKPGKAGLLWTKKHPEVYKGWLANVKTTSGKPALPAFEKFLKTVH
ncbi:MAG: ABC transporter substrate-binding protein [Thermodesulfobacteriota bacterium]|nr:ABC transporter substrate-binding protein [Thermodesulfobacteriota bacterium]